MSKQPRPPGSSVITGRMWFGIAFVGLFRNRWLWGAVLLSLLLYTLVVYVPFLQRAFDTVPLGSGDWLRCTLVASSVLLLRELSKVVARHL
jgi:Ca2+-transporting ATPase